MAENLTTADVAAYTGRLDANAPETLRALNAALARVRRYCGWHVSPVRSEIFTVNGTGHSYLFLPTGRIATLVSVTEDGEALDLSTIRPDASAPGILAKDGWYPWKCGFSNIEVELTHGYAAADAEDFREAVLSLIDQATLSIGTGRSGPMISKEVDDVRYGWSGLPGQVDDAPMNKSLLAPFRLIAFA